MKKILIDTNIALDILLNRHPGYTHAAVIFSMIRQKTIESYISASAVTDIFYLAQKNLGKNPTKEAMKDMFQVFRPATVTDSHIYQALDLEWSDFEDSVQYIVGEDLAVDYIVTRNTHDFSPGSIPAVTPEDFIKLITDNTEQ